MQNIVDKLLKKKIVDITQQCFALLPQVTFHDNNLNFYWRWRWWYRIQAIFLNIFYFSCLKMVWTHPNRPLCSTGPTIYSYTRPGQVSERPFVYYYRYRRIPNLSFFQILRIGGKEGVREREWSKRQKVWISILIEFPSLPKRVIA